MNYNLNLNKEIGKIKYNRINSDSQLKDGMKIVIKEVNGTNGYEGDKFKTVQVGRYVCSNFLINDNPNAMWTLKKSKDGWKIQLPNGKWLDRNLLGYLVSTDNEKSAITFKFDFTDSETAKVHYGKYYMYADSKKTLDLSKDNSDEFEIYG